MVWRGIKRPVGTPASARARALAWTARCLRLQRLAPRLWTDWSSTPSGGAHGDRGRRRRSAGRTGARATAGNVGDRPVVLAYFNLSGAKLGAIQLLDCRLSFLLTTNHTSVTFQGNQDEVSARVTTSSGGGAGEPSAISHQRRVCQSFGEGHGTLVTMQ